MVLITIKIQYSIFKITAWVGPGALVQLGPSSFVGQAIPDRMTSQLTTGVASGSAKLGTSRSGWW